MKIKENKTALQAHWLKYLILIVIVGIIGVTITCIRFFKTDRIDRNSYVTIEFAYDGATKNLTTSGEQLSVDEIKNDEILEKALETTGLAGKYTAEQIKNSIVINGSYPKNVIDELKSYQSIYDFSDSTRLSVDSYYPTRYTVHLYDSFDENISKNDLTNLVKAIAEVYRDYFLQKYVYSFDMSSVDKILMSEEADYSNQLEIAALRIDLMDDYTKKMYALETSFRSGGKSFNDLSIRCQALRDSLEKIEGIVVTEAVTTSMDRMRDRYRYETKVLETEKKYKQECIARFDELIEGYQKDNILYIASGDQIIKVDSNSKETYEKLIEMKRTFTDRILEIDTLLNDYTYYLSAYTKETPATAEIKASVASKIEDLNASILALEGDITSLSNAYNEKITGGDAVTVSSVYLTSAKLLSGSFIVSLIKNCAPIGAFAIAIICIHGFFYDAKKYKKERQVI